MPCSISATVKVGIQVKLDAVSAVRHQLDPPTGRVVAHLSDHSYQAVAVDDGTEFGQQQLA